MSEPSTIERKTADELRVLLAAEPLGGIWRHKKTGRIYSILQKVIIESTLEPGVVYWCSGDLIPFVRPVAEFLERFERAD
jgi:hypothetical protein